jgi:hypothetical protein
MFGSLYKKELVILACFLVHWTNNWIFRWFIPVVFDVYT